MQSIHATHPHKGIRSLTFANLFAFASSQIDDVELSGASLEAVTLSASMAMEMGQTVGAALQQAIRHETKKPVSRR